ncbi:MAG: condensation domain-containing protein, partial [Phormidium sp.]
TCEQNPPLLYKTGDLARYLPDGNIEYLGRIDNQVKIRGFRIELGEIESILGQHPQVETSIVIVREDNPGDKRLAAYVVAAAEAKLTSAQLRQYLKSKLPEYMIPSAVVLLEALPLTTNGKVDRRALPKPESRSGIEKSIVAPRNQTEETLAQIWKQVLGIEKLGIDDNFFELGGDSILSIQIISRAKLAGIELTVKQLFTNQTIAELATVAGTSKTAQIPQELVTGKVELTPIQKWFFEQELPEVQHFNQSFLLTTPPDFQAELLEPVWQELVRHHDALRLSFQQTESGWSQTQLTPTDKINICYYDLSELQETEIEPAIESRANSLQASLNLAEKLLQIGYFKLGEEKPGKLLIIIHHLVVDGISWRILLEDFQRAYQQLGQKQAIQLPPKTSAFQEWAKRLTAYAQTESLKTELNYWLPEESDNIKSALPQDYPGAENTIASANTVSVSLNESETKALLQEVPSAYKTQINDVLLTALAIVISRWTKSPKVLLNLEGHGREEIIEGVDISRTVGWFTTIFPVLIEVEETENLGTIIKSVKEKLRGIPHKGIGYGILRYLCHESEIVSQLQRKEPAQISFNYLGQFSQITNQSSIIQLAKESSGKEQSVEGQRAYILEINGIISEERLQIDWTYSSNLHQWETIEKIAEEFGATLREIITHCLAPENGGYTPSDFPLVQLTQQQLDGVIVSLFNTAGQEREIDWRNVEDIYPLSPMQQGMLFESLYAPNSGVYFEQITCSLNGNLDIKIFEQAWQQVVAHNSIFRTAFIWESLPEPVQVVLRKVEVKLHTDDWRKLSPQEQQQELQAFLAAQRQQGFHFEIAPLMRLNLLQLDDNTYEFVWSHHHILLDGWSLPLVFQKLLNRYEAITQGRIFDYKPSKSYRHYIGWLEQQDKSQAQAYWQEKLLGFSAPTPLMVDKPLSIRNKDQVSYGEQEISLSVPVTTNALSFVREHQLTLNNLVSATWALLLSRYSQETDVVFGATVSGRPPAIAGVESMVGLFINTLPMRVQISAQTEILGLLKDIQTQLVESEQFSYSSLVEIQAHSDVPRGTALFDSIVVFENYPVDSALGEEQGSFSFSNFQGIERTNYPLTLIVSPGKQLLLKLIYDTNRFDDGSISRMLGHFVTMLCAIATNPQQPLAQLPILTEVEQQQLLIEWNNSQVDYPVDKCLHQLFEEQVAKTPDAVAVVFEEQQLTYRELNDRSNQLAHYLRSLGVEAEVLVGICVERSLETIVGLLGILKAGGAYVPLDPNYPPDRIQFLLEDASVPVLLTQEHLVNRLPEQNKAHLVYLDTNRLEVTSSKEIAYRCEVQPSNLASVLYTSGSTGRPKAVAIEHHSPVALISWAQSVFSPEQLSGVLASTSICFDLSVFEIFV